MAALLQGQNYHVRDDDDENDAKMEAGMMEIMIKHDDIYWVTRRRWQRCSKVQKLS